MFTQPEPSRKVDEFKNPAYKRKAHFDPRYYQEIEKIQTVDDLYAFIEQALQKSAESYYHVKFVTPDQLNAEPITLESTTQNAYKIAKINLPSLLSDLFEQFPELMVGSVPVNPKNGSPNIYALLVTRYNPTNAAITRLMKQLKICRAIQNTYGNTEVANKYIELINNIFTKVSPYAYPDSDPVTGKVKLFQVEADLLLKKVSEEKNFTNEVMDELNKKYNTFIKNENAIKPEWEIYFEHDRRMTAMLQKIKLPDDEDKQHGARNDVVRGLIRQTRALYFSFDDLFERDFEVIKKKIEAFCKLDIFIQSLISKDTPEYKYQVLKILDESVKDRLFYSVKDAILHGNVDIEDLLRSNLNEGREAIKLIESVMDNLGEPNAKLLDELFTKGSKFKEEQHIINYYLKVLNDYVRLAHFDSHDLKANFTKFLNDFIKYHVAINNLLGSISGLDNTPKANEALRYLKETASKQFSDIPAMNVLGETEWWKTPAKAFLDNFQKFYQPFEFIIQFASEHQSDLAKKKLADMDKLFESPMNTEERLKALEKIKSEFLVLEKSNLQTTDPNQKLTNPNIAKTSNRNRNIAIGVAAVGVAILIAAVAILATGGIAALAGGVVLAGIGLGAVIGAVVSHAINIKAAPKKSPVISSSSLVGVTDSLRKTPGGQEPVVENAVKVVAKPGEKVDRPTVNAVEEETVSRQSSSKRK